MRVALVMALLLLAAPAGAEPLAAALAAAARTGDVTQQAALKAREFAQPVTLTRLWRDGHAYRDLLVTAAGDPAAPGAPRVALLVRIPVKLLDGPLPKALAVRGRVTDFEPVPVDGKLTWLPFVLATEARAMDGKKKR